MNLYDDLRAALTGGFVAWEGETRMASHLPVIPAQELAERLKQNKAPSILDLRSEVEWRAGFEVVGKE